MTPIRAVFAAVVCGLVAGSALVVAGVAVLAGPGWALIACGGLLSVESVGVGAVLLSDPGGKR